MYLYCITPLAGVETTVILAGAGAGAGADAGAGAGAGKGHAKTAPKPFKIGARTSKMKPKTYPN